ncbi:MAG: DNA repair protein RecN [Bacteroidales bacterium]|nr:DNA repair protein RecN [Bacteroidales bacterium]
MIKSLHISNYALIDEIDIDFAPGFNIITGETGAGKSIILGALTLLLGGRADLKAVRDASRKSVIEAVFNIEGATTVIDLLKESDVDSPDAPECILRRELSPGGRSRAFINDTLVTLPVLRQIAVRLVDIHSQHQNLLLASPEYQLEIIDSLADNRQLLEDYSAAYAAYRETLKKYTTTRDLIRRNQDDADFIAYQYSKLEEMDLMPGEHEALEQEREILQNVGDIKETLAGAIEPLVSGQVNALDLLYDALAALQNMADSMADNHPDIDFKSLSERVETARIEIADVADTLMDYDSTIADDPQRLEEVDQRLSDLYSLERKHNVENADQLIELRERLRSQIDALENAEDLLAGLETAAKRAKKAALNIAIKISERRIATAADFAAELRRIAAPLGMQNLRCEISFTKGKLGLTGFDQIQFLFAFNKNQALMPVGSTASGGEISRLMLTVKTIVAERMALPTIIFDEVDSGVSGDVAGRMAMMMASIGRKIQVITITHLPGVAAMGVRHFKVYKEDTDTATTTRIRPLSENEREGEIALMISGSATEPAALANARALLSKAKSENKL